MKWHLFIMIVILYIASAPHLLADNESTSKSISLTRNQSTIKIIKRNELQNEGRFLAKQGRYDEALIKYRAAMDPSLLNYDYEKGVAESAVIDIYKRQGRFEEALDIMNHQLSILKNEKYPISGVTGYERAHYKHLELLALIKTRDTKNTTPIYTYIDYLKAKDKENGFAPDSHANTLIHLYDYLHDYDAGIAFMDELIKYHAQHPNKNHRSAHAKDVREYTRVKQAWELDKKTGKHGHLQEVIKTSDVISW